ncbi:hypothetical protein BC831DRAFT_529872 [Entophlyctis helioformis]|nr:hypothetical protein BC831DRAFT_529872 [Entophlyctis helioformis]
MSTKMEMPSMLTPTVSSLSVMTMVDGWLSVCVSVQCSSRSVGQPASQPVSQGVRVKGPVKPSFQSLPPSLPHSSRPSLAHLCLAPPNPARDLEVNYAMWPATNIKLDAVWKQPSSAIGLPVTTTVALTLKPETLIPVAIIAMPFALNFLLAGAGFTAAGISSNSLAASWMSGYCGSVPANSVFASLQSLGASGGLGFGSKQSSIMLSLIAAYLLNPLGALLAAIGFSKTGIVVKTLGLLWQAIYHPLGSICSKVLFIGMRGGIGPASGAAILATGLVVAAFMH